MSSLCAEPALVEAIAEGVRMRQANETSISLTQFHEILTKKGVPTGDGKQVFLTLSWGALRNYISDHLNYRWPHGGGTRRQA